jgi:hypothetical protein
VWRTERNPARAALEAKHGYDTKHAMHLLRLMRMGHELLATGTLMVRRPDAQELSDIRDGALSFDALLALATKTLAEIELAAAASQLPEATDPARVDALYQRVATAEP